MTKRKVLVVGAGGAVGCEIVRLLCAGGSHVLAAYRTQRPGLEATLRDFGANPVQLDLNDTEKLSELLNDVEGAIFTPILTVSAKAAALLRKDQHAVFCSSNNAAIDHNAEVYAKLRDAEKAVLDAAPQAVILRPTMIYGYPGDGNLSRLMRAMRRWPFVPMPGRGTALQQPTFYKDLAHIAADVLFDESTKGLTRPVAGPKMVSQRTLYKTVAAAADVSAKPIGVPLGPSAALLGLFERVGLRLPVSAAQLQRADMDKTPIGANPILGETTIAEGLAHLAAALDEGRSGA